MDREPDDRRTTDRRSSTGNIAAVVGALVVAVLLIWWLVGGFDYGGEQIAETETDTAGEQVGAGVEGEMEPAVEGELGNAPVTEGAEGETQVAE